MQIQVKVENKQVIQSLTKLGPAVEGLVNADIKRAMDAAQRDLQQPGKPITYPVKWDSEKQRRAFFATDGFGRGIPTRRTGAYNRGWQVEKTGSGNVRAYRLYNNAPGTKYIGGDAKGGSQSRIHGGRWAIAANVVRKHVEKLLLDVPTAIKRAIRSAGMGT